MTTQISGTTGCSLVQDSTITSAKIVDGSVTNTDLATPVAAALVCKAWVTFDSTKNAAGSVDATNTNRFIKASNGVASVLKNSLGDYTITFSSAMADANYAFSGSAIQSATGASTATVCLKFATTPTTSAINIAVVYGGSNFIDVERVSVMFFGN